MELSKCLGCMEPFECYPCPKCGYDPEKDKHMEYALPPETILAGKYLVGKVLGQGGFGITYIGWDIPLERKVAIKEYYPSGQVSRNPGTRNLTWYSSEQSLHARQDGMKMFLKEARKMVKADSIPGVVRVLDLFQENGTAYIVMEFVEGETLKARLLRDGSMDWEAAKKIFRPVISAMEQVHAFGLIHRDLSPDNLMLLPDGSVKILDLGAAKDLSLNSGASSMQVAKSGFSPLEQYIQRGGSGTWTDVYAMAATIYYTLTGTLIPGAVERLEKDTISWDFPALNRLPAQAREALKKALAVQAKDRTQTMEALEKGLFAEPVKVQPKPVVEKKTPVEPTANSGKREKPKIKKLWLVAIAAVLVALAFAIPVAPSNTMREDICSYHWQEKEQCYEDQPVFGSSFTRRQIRRIEFLSSTASAASNAWDISANADGSVLAWTVPAGELYTLYIAANGKVYAPENCWNLFALYENLESIDFNGVFDTSKVTDMTYMFSNCESLETLDVSSFDTSNVKAVSAMFSECSNLKSLDLRNLDFQNIWKTDQIFEWCTGLKEVKANKLHIRPVDVYQKDVMEIENATVYPRITTSPLLQCKEITVKMDVQMSLGTKNTVWDLWASVDGKFKKIAKINLPGGDGSVTQTITFDKPINIESLVPIPICNGGCSWSMDFEVQDAWVGVY